MIQNVNKRLNKALLLKESPIYHEVFVCDSNFDEDISHAQLTACDLIEIGFVTCGSGIHRILEQNIPCKEGDIYIVPPDIPHGYFISDESKTLTVRRLLLDLKDWYDGEVAIPTKAQRCWN